ncbi:Methylcrotonoyl-CoA carboxylase subunit alpha, mitochondrial [Rhizoclosmatium sp. JEL0117]|nr:Methylcrotonoyl-CoA carboxylase subunit alpha, mitochondrial [Rhizoclosmatium sp. JEL0117]
MPDTGPLHHLSFPEASSAVRIETGVQQGDVVSVHYDPMISKLVVKGSDRTEALRVLRKALGDFHVVGLNTNIEFLKRLSSHPEFISGDVETGFIKKYYDDLFPAPVATPPTTLAHAALVLYSAILPATTGNVSPDPWSIAPVAGFRLNSPQGSTRTFTFIESEKPVNVAVTLCVEGQGSYNVTIADAAGKETTFAGVRVLSYDNGQLVADIGDRRVKGRVVREGEEKVHVFSEGAKTTLHLAPNPANVAHASHGSVGSVKTPMPCKISSVSVKAGDKVTKGQNLIVLEAMKMEHVIKSPKEGVIKRVHYGVGEIVGEGKVLVTFEDE